MSFTNQLNVGLGNVNKSLKQQYGSYESLENQILSEIDNLNESQKTKNELKKNIESKKPFESINR